MREGGSWTAFLVMAFAVLGLVGAFATYAAQIPLERALARNATLDRVLADAGDPQKLADLRPSLDDSAARVLDGPGELATRVAAERARLLPEAGAAAADIGLRLRIVLAAFTAASALFGVMVLGIVRRQRTE